MPNDTSGVEPGKKPDDQPARGAGDRSASFLSAAVNAFRNARKRIEREHFLAMTEAACGNAKDRDPAEPR